MNSEEITIRLADPAAPASLALVHAMEQEIEELYADRPGSIHSVGASPEQMSAPHGAFVTIVADGRDVACGGLKRLDDETCEIKRMYVLPEARGRGLSSRLLEALEGHARRLGYTRARLDTGDRQPAAKHLYDSWGYLPIDNYNGNTAASYWFERELG